MMQLSPQWSTIAGWTRELASVQDHGQAQTTYWTTRP